MRRGQNEVGAPYVSYRNTKANIEALTGLIGGETAHATDTGENGYYDEVAVAWVWGGGGGGGGHTIQDEGTPLTARTNLNFTGAGVTVTDDAGNDQTDVTIPAASATKLDDMAAPDDNTDLNASTTAHGLLLKATAPAANELNVVGIANGETSYSNKDLFNTSAPANLAAAASAGTSIQAARSDHVHLGLTSAQLTDLTDGGGTTLHTHAYTSLTSRPAMADSSTIVYNSPSATSSSAFTGTIATLPGTVNLTYTPVSGNEDTLPQDTTGTSRSAQQRLYNTTRGTYALINTVNTGTNSIALTANVPAGWTVGDTITTLSPTLASGGGFNWVDLEVTSDVFLNKAYIRIYVILTDTGGAGGILRVHPFETYAASKIVRITTQSTQQTSFILPLALNTNVISVAWVATGAGTFTFSIRSKENVE